ADWLGGWSARSATHLCGRARAACGAIGRLGRLMRRLRVQLEFDVTADDLPHSLYNENLRTAMWDYVTRLVREFNRDYALTATHYKARFQTATVDVRTVPTPITAAAPQKEASSA